MNSTKAPQACRSRLDWLYRRIRAVRAFSFPVSVLPVLVAVAVVRPLSQWDWAIVTASILGVVLLHAAGNLVNDYFDCRSGVDQKVEGDERRPGRVLVRGQLAPRDVLLESIASLVLVLPVAAYLLWQCGPGLLWFGATAILALYAYTGPPFQLKYRALGEPLIFVVFGPLLMVGAAYAQTRTWHWPVLLLSIPVGIMTTAILVGNNLRDYHEDRAAGIVTVAQVMGERACRLLYTLCVLVPVLGVALLGVVLFGVRLLIAAPALLVLLWRPLTDVWQGKRVTNIDVKTAQFESALLLLLLTAFVLNGGVEHVR